MSRTENQSKRFGNVEAVKSLNLEVVEGTAYGFIGPNGAGKSTTMSILATLLAPRRRPQSRPYLIDTNAPCVLASERASRPVDERRVTGPSSA